MGYSIESLSADCYEGTSCLINKFGITDEKILSRIEADITFAKASNINEAITLNSFDFEHYKAIHKYLFDAIYDWAGTIRKVNISKKGTNFVDANQIETFAKNCFDRLKANNCFRNMDFDSFIENLVDFYCSTNLLHPFREGNGRTQRAFFVQLIHYCGYEWDISKVDQDELMIASIQSANGITDLLKEILSRTIQKQ